MNPKLINEERAYLAGLFDGEGCIMIYSPSDSKRGYSVRAYIGSTDRDIIEWLKSKTEIGTIYINTKKNDEHPKWNESWIWAVQDRNGVYDFLRAIQPYLQIKRRQEKVVKVLKLIEDQIEKSDYWSEEEDDILRINYHRLPTNNKTPLQKLIQRSRHAIQQRAFRLNLTKPNKRTLIKLQETC